MESITHTSSSTSLSLARRHPNLGAENGFSFSRSFNLRLRQTCSPLGHWKALVVQAKNDNKDNHKRDSHSFVPKPDESSGFFPEAVLLKEKKVQEDGKILPEFADEEERQLYDTLNLQLQSELNVERMRHYEVVFLIHEKHAEEVGSVSEKVQDFLREKKGKIWRVSDWGLRRLAYKIQKAENAHYMLMNFELEAKWINDFKALLDRDERVIRHLVMKSDEATTEDCPPPPEWHTLRASGDDYDEEEFDDEGEDYDDEFDDEGEDYDDEFDDVEVYVEDEGEDAEQMYDDDDDDNDNDDNDDGDSEDSIGSGSDAGSKNQKAHQLV